MGTRTITGTLIDPTGDAWTSASIRFELLTTFATQSDSVVLQREETATTDGSGDFSITLQVPDADAWAYRCTLPDGNTFEFNLESGDATTLHDIMADANLSATVSPSALSEALADYALAADVTAHIADTSDVHGLTATSSLTALGANAAYSNIGTNVTAAGVYAAINNTGDDVTATGRGAAAYNIGTNVTANGVSAAINNTGDDVTATGYYAARDNTGQRGTFIGYGRGQGNSDDDRLEIGNENTALISGTMGVTSAASSVTLNADVIIVGNLPTSDPGVAGQLWRDGGAINVSIG